MEDAALLRRQAEQARRLGSQMTTSAHRDRILQYASELEQQAIEAESLAVESDRREANG